MARLPFAVILSLLLLAPVVAHAGGASMLEQDINAGTDGPPFFGFVREDGGGGIGDAKVTAELHGGSLVTTTDILGLYKLPGFGATVNPDDVSISCAKAGYKQVNVVRRPNGSGDARDPIEIDCYLQKE